jgi:signal transduction histidine kinase
LSMSDNGKGIGQKMINSSKSLGLIGMRERCQHLGGAIAIRGKPGQGTTITVNLPAGEASSDKNTGG